MNKDTAELVVKFAEDKLKEDPNFQKLSDDAKAICLILGSCLVVTKFVNVISEGVSDFYERFH